MTETMLILGAGAPGGVGGAVALRFAKAGYHVLVTGRTLEKVEATRAAIAAQEGSADAMSCDVTSEQDLDAVFGALAAKEMPVASVIYNAGNNAPISFEALTPEQFETYWRVCCLGGFLAAKRAMPLLARQGRGSMLFTGASASLRGKPNFAHFSSAKGALRNLVQALAREYGPQGVHAAHIIIDGVVNGDQVKSRFGGYLDKLGEDGALDPAAIAEVFWMVHNQPRSAWTQELDLRPFKEAW
ncbi:SDR family NAD(P)-dependent oxidoreductase [Hyphomonas sp.]|uniref:SDR family NAD(P)-dependent oxidoreductase n=1 Tax=Hyphomonas sp. TaxID=87 RepID=UPI0032EB4B92